jgi:choline dehydrogenase
VDGHGALGSSLRLSVLGGGTAGCALAARLSEDPSRSVCLLEAGPDYGAYESGRWPQEMLDARAVPKTHDWGLEDDVSLVRARIVGGCSAHNACFVVWGAREDYDEWASRGGESWTFASLEPCLRHAEAQLRTREPTRDELSAWHRGALEAAVASGFPRLGSFNDLDSAQGVAPIPLNAVGETRWNTAFAYLDAARARPNLELIADAVVDRVLLDRDRAIGALARVHGKAMELHAGCVVVAAGAYGSPAILMRSGIGPEDHLRELGIPVEVACPGVGSTLIDHSGANVFFQPNERLMSELRAQEERGQLFQGQCAIRVRTEACPEGLWDLHLLPWASRIGTWPGQLEADIVEGDFEAHITVFAMKPASRGQVRLASAEPDALPLVEQRFLWDSGGRDLKAIVQGVELVRELAAAPQLAELIDHEAFPGPFVADREALEAWVRETVRGYFHPVGTCAMGPTGDEQAVVDATGRVHGVEGLYVADASVMPTIPRANTNLATAAVAERLAELIVADRSDEETGSRI